METKELEYNSPAARLQASRRWEYKVAARQKYNAHCLESIWHFLNDNGIVLPRYKSQYKENKSQILQYEEYGDQLEISFGRLINMYYTIKDSGLSLGAAFMGNDGQIETQTIVHACSRAKLDQVWILRKEQIIRKTYRNWLAQGMTEGWLFNFTPVHIVLTVPHADGLYKGKRFYGDEILNDFNLIRKNALWLAMVHGGEYGLETKRGSHWKMGLHIHVHSFALLNQFYDTSKFDKLSRFDLIQAITWADTKKYQIFESEEEAEFHFSDFKKADLVRLAVKLYKGRRVTPAALQNVLFHLWRKQTGAFKIWVEKLYRFKKGSDKKWLTEYVKPKGFERGKGETEINILEPGDDAPPLKLQRKKFYIDEDSPLEDWTAGILECIKYHFKGDTFYNPKTKEWDVLLMMEVLNNTVNKRFYGRYGAFYKTPQLSFNFGAEDTAAGVLPEYESGEIESVKKRFPLRTNMIEEIMRLSKVADLKRLMRTSKNRLAEILASMLRGETEKENRAKYIETEGAEIESLYTKASIVSMINNYRAAFTAENMSVTDLAQMLAAHLYDKANAADYDPSKPAAVVEDSAPKAANVINNLINPFTMEVEPSAESWDYCVYHPGDRKHTSRYAVENNCVSRETDLTKFTFFSKNISRKTLIRAMMTNRLNDVKKKDQTTAESEALVKNLMNLDHELNRLGAYSDYVFSFRNKVVNWTEYDSMGPVNKMKYMVDCKIKYLSEKGVSVSLLKNGQVHISGGSLFDSGSITVKEQPMNTIQQPKKDQYGNDPDLPF